MEAAKACVEPNPAQTEDPNRQQQTAVERSKQAALLSCQVSEGGLVWGGQNSNMDPTCDLPGPPLWKPALPTWEDLEPQANFTEMTMPEKDIQEPPKPTADWLKKRTKIEKNVEAPNKCSKIPNWR